MKYIANKKQDSCRKNEDDSICWNCIKIYKLIHKYQLYIKYKVNVRIFAISIDLFELLNYLLLIILFVKSLCLIWYIILLNDV